MKKPRTISRQAGSGTRRVLIRTLPLTTGNYGGILQAFALQTAIERLGSFDVDIDITRRLGRRSSWKHAILALKSALLPIPIFAVERRDAMNVDVLKFLDRIRTVRVFGLRRRPRPIIGTYDFFVSGSDQIFRPAYGDVASYLFDFLDDNAA